MTTKPLLVPIVPSIPTWRMREIVRTQAGSPIAPDRLKALYGIDDRVAVAIEKAAAELRSMNPVEGCEA